MLEKCPECGFDLIEHDAFCNSCGFDVRNYQPTTNEEVLEDDEKPEGHQFEHVVKMNDKTQFWVCPNCGRDPQMKDERQYCPSCKFYLSI